MARRRLAIRDGFGFVFVRPVLEGSSEPGAACFAAGLATGRLNGVVHMDRPQVGVLQVVFGPVGDEAALHVCPAGRPKQRALSKSKPTKLELVKRNSATKQGKRKRDKENIP